MKHIFELPTDVLHHLFCVFVEYHGVRVAVKVKRTCRTFNKGVSLAIWSTRALESPGADFQDAWGSECLFADCLLHRTQADRVQHYHKLTGTIYETVDYLRQRFGILLDANLDYVREACLAIAYSSQDVSIVRRVRRLRVREALRQPVDDYTVQENVLAFAAYLGLHSVVEQLVEKGVRDRPSCFGSPLICASKHSDCSIIDTYLKARLRLRERCEPSFTSTSYICAARETIATFQKSHLRDISSDMYGEAIAAATMYGKSETVKVLVEASLHDGEISACIPPIKMPITAIDLKLDSLPDRWTHLLIYAVECGKPDVVQLALDHGADPNAQYYIMTGWYSALGNAADYGETAIFQQLLKQGADLKIAGEDDLFLNRAVSGGSLEIVRLCLDAGMESMPGRPPVLRHTLSEPLTAAVQINSSEMVRLLLAKGFGFGPHNHGYRVISECAREVGNQEIIGLLEDFHNGQSIRE